LRVEWHFANGALLTLLANFAEEAITLDQPPDGRVLYSTGDVGLRDALGPVRAVFFLA
jgi:hypothetical protein